MIVLLLFVLFMMSGCSTDSDKSVTGDFVTKEPRGLVQILVSPDSLNIVTSFKKNIGSSSYALAGRYEGAEAFALFKFSLERINKDNLIGAYLKFDVENVWRDGEAEFDLFETHSDWSDTTRIDNDNFPERFGSPVSTVSDTASVFTTLTFDIDPEVIRAMSDKGSFLVQSSGSGKTMVSILSDDTNYPPSLKLIKESETGVVDTTGVSSSEGTYYFNTGLADGSPVLSEGDASGFVLHVGLTGTVSPLAVINRCILKMTVSENIFPEDTFSVNVYKLNSEFTTIDEVDKDTSNSLNISLTPDTETYELNITSIVNDWHTGGNSNFGLLIEPFKESSSPNQCVFAPGDSLLITYTPFPEVK